MSEQETLDQDHANTFFASGEHDCPYCGAKLKEHGCYEPIEPEDDICQDVSCDSCGHWWAEHYGVVAISDEYSNVFDKATA